MDNKLFAQLKEALEETLLFERGYIASRQEIADGIRRFQIQQIKNKKPLVINLFGSPGAGKSTGAAIVFSKLKMMGINAELVTEFAKDKTWEHNATALGCQEYVFGKQSYRLARCKEDVDVIITDSPLPLSILYTTNEALLEDGAFEKVVINVFNSYHNCNYYLNRTKEYNPKGRNQTEEQSDVIAGLTKQLLDGNGIRYVEVTGDAGGYQEIIDDVLDYLGHVEPKEQVLGNGCKECPSYP